MMIVRPGHQGIKFSGFHWVSQFGPDGECKKSVGFCGRELVLTKAILIDTDSFIVVFFLFYLEYYIVFLSLAFPCGGGVGREEWVE